MGREYGCTFRFSRLFKKLCIMDFMQEWIFILFQKRNQRWRAAQRAYGAVLPQAVVDDLVNRELSENDYDLLMQLDR